MGVLVWHHGVGMMCGVFFPCACDDTQDLSVRPFACTQDALEPPFLLYAHFSHCDGDFFSLFPASFFCCFIASMIRFLSPIGMSEI